MELIAVQNNVENQIISEDEVITITSILELFISYRNK